MVQANLSQVKVVPANLSYYKSFMGKLVKKEKQTVTDFFIHSCLFEKVTFLLLIEKEAKGLKVD